MIQETLKRLRLGEPLSEDTCISVFNALLDGQATPAQVGAFLMSLSQRGETVSEIVAGARVLRDRAISILSPEGTVDCCGTGGDHSGSLNISTAVAFIVAACGVPVAKHGNRAASSKSGAADALESLGVNLDLSPDKCQLALNELGYCFLMAPKFHASLKPLASLRKELGFRTIFNLLGPLANPAGTRTQLLGVFDKHWIRPMAESLRALGSTSALVVHGSDGLDEITLCGETHCARLQNGTIEEFSLTPASFGLPQIKAEDISGQDSDYNAKALLKLLQGERSAYRNIVLANAAATLHLAGKAIDLKEGVALAGKAIDTGLALKILEDYISFSKHHA